MDSDNEPFDIHKAWTLKDEKEFMHRLKMNYSNKVYGQQSLMNTVHKRLKYAQKNSLKGMNGMDIYSVGYGGMSSVKRMHTFMVIGTQPYIVTTIDTSLFCCTCPSFIFRGEECKHIKYLKTQIGKKGFPLISVEEMLGIYAGNVITSEAQILTSPDGLSPDADDGNEVPSQYGDDTDSTMKYFDKEEYDIKDEESIRKALIGMHENARDEDHVFREIQIMLRNKEADKDTKEMLKHYASLIVMGWEDLMEELMNGED